MTDLLVIAEAQIAEKQVKEIEAIKQRLEQDKDALKEAIALVNSHTLYKRVDDEYHRGCYRYVLATEEMLKKDYLGEPKSSWEKGISFDYDSYKGRYNRGIMVVNGHDYYDIRYALMSYEKTIQDKKSRVDDLNSTIRDLEEELETLNRNYPTLKQAITEWMEYQSKNESEGQEEQ